MRYLFAIIPLLYLQTACSQLVKVVKDSRPKNTELNDSTDIIVCGIVPEASVDWGKWTAYLNDNLVLDEASLDSIPAGTYTVLIQFVVDSKGKISDVLVLKDPGHGLGQRVANAISHYEELWEPAKLNGSTTFSYRTNPITFIVEEAEDCEDELPAGSML